MVQNVVNDASNTYTSKYDIPKPSQRPIAAFIIGPNAAGKTQTLKDWLKIGYKLDVRINYDEQFAFTYNQQKGNLSDEQLRLMADEVAWRSRDAMFDHCIKNKLGFSYETVLS